MKIVGIALVIALAALPLGAIAKECATCGSTLTDSGRCPYCKPKPKVVGQ